MAKTPESMQPQAEADPATLAFEALREEVALVRRAVAGLAAERASIEIPDYSETLGQIMRASSATRQSVKALAEMPALRLSAKDWSHEIATAAQEARHSNQQAFAEANSTPHGWSSSTRPGPRPTWRASAGGREKASGFGSAFPTATGRPRPSSPACASPE